MVLRKSVIFNLFFADESKYYNIIFLPNSNFLNF
jgi:hypothetical protein